MEAAGAGQTATVAVAPIAALIVVGLGAVWLGLPPRRPGGIPLQGTPGSVADWANYLRVVSVPVAGLPRKVRGRDDVLRALQRQWRRGGLAVLAGRGGAGKSTIAHELVRRAQSSRRG